MALTWNWNKKVGELFTEQTIGGETRQFVHPLYNGNALLIMTNEWEEDGVEKYGMYNFWVDEHHMKACLGLIKNADGVKRNIYKDGWDKWTKIRLSKSCRDLNKIVKALVAGFDSIIIEIYTEEEK